MHVLKSCFSNEDLLLISRKLCLFENLDEHDLKLNEKIYNKITSKVLTIKNYFLSFVVSNFQYDYLESLINDRLSIENILLKKENKAVGELSNDVDSRNNYNYSFLKKLDFLSSPFSLRIDGKSTFGNKFGKIFTFIHLVLLGFVIYYSGIISF